MMDPWSNFSTDPSTSRQSRYSSVNALPQNSGSSPQEYASPQPPSQQTPHHAQQGYQTYHGQAGTATAVTSSNTRLENTNDFTDIQMQDAADTYSRGKFQQQPQQQQQARQPFVSEDSSSTQRYSPMPQQGQYTTSQTTNLPPMSSYQQNRHSPSRPNYTNASQSYYSNASAATSPRSGALPPIQNYQHPLQQSASMQQSGPLPAINPPLSLDPINLGQNIGTDSNGGGRYYSQTATTSQTSHMFEHPSPTTQPSPPRDPPPRLQRVNNMGELQPRINAQPVHRRANPEGGFISVGAARPVSLDPC
jgi:dual specificity protein kinase YAK1